MRIVYIAEYFANVPIRLLPACNNGPPLYYILSATCVLAFLRLALSGATPPPPASWLAVDWTEREWGVAAGAVAKLGRAAAPPISLQPGEEGGSSIT